MRKLQCIIAVSYTHLDVYKRQIVLSALIYISVSVLNMGKTKSSIKDFSDPATEIQQTVQPTAIPNVSRDTIVAVTRTGTRYHRPDCKHVQDRGSVVYMTMEEAINAEYEPCTDCRPVSYTHLDVYKRQLICKTIFMYHIALPLII